ncbi:hypothetical protein DMENIID0001_063600 [Sergentomyia squamirostris]
MLNVAGNLCEKTFDSLYYKYCQYHCMLLDDELLAQGYPSDEFPYYQEMEFCKKYIDLPVWSQKVRKMAGLIKMLNTGTNSMPEREYPPQMQSGFNQFDRRNVEYPPGQGFDRNPDVNFGQRPMQNFGNFPPDRSDRSADFPMNHPERPFDFPNRPPLNEWGPPGPSQPMMGSVRNAGDWGRPEERDFPHQNHQRNEWGPPQPVPPPDMRNDRNEMHEMSNKYGQLDPPGANMRNLHKNQPQEWERQQPLPNMRNSRTPQPVPPPNMRGVQNPPESIASMRIRQDPEPRERTPPQQAPIMRNPRDRKPNEWGRPPSQSILTPDIRGAQNQRPNNWESPEPRELDPIMRNRKSEEPNQWTPEKPVSNIRHPQKTPHNDLDEEGADEDSIDFFFRSVSEQIKKAQLNTFKFLDLQMVILNGLNQKLMIYRDFGSNPIPPASFDHQLMNLDNDQSEPDLLPPSFPEEDEEDLRDVLTWRKRKLMAQQQPELSKRKRPVRPNLTQLT